MTLCRNTEIIFLENGVDYHPYIINSDSFSKSLDFNNHFYLQGTRINELYSCKSLRKTKKEIRITVANNTDTTVKILDRELNCKEYEYFIDNFQKNFEKTCEDIGVSYSTQDYLPESNFLHY